MKIQLTMNELKCLALHQLGLQAEIKSRSGLTMLVTPHEIEVLNGPVEIGAGEIEKGFES